MARYRNALGDQSNADRRPTRTRVVDRVIDLRFHRQLQPATAHADSLIAELVAAGVELTDDDKHLLRSFGQKLWWDSFLHQKVQEAAAAAHEAAGQG